jgi:hypothetical protein
LVYPKAAPRLRAAVLADEADRTYENADLDAGNRPLVCAYRLAAASPPTGPRPAVTRYA